MEELIYKFQAVDAIVDELEKIDHVPKWVFDRLEGRLKQLPSAQPKRGKWIWNGDTLDWERLHYCSECKKYALRDTDGKEVLSVFCPHCGAKMER